MPLCITTWSSMSLPASATRSIYWLSGHAITSSIRCRQYFASLRRFQKAKTCRAESIADLGSAFLSAVLRMLMGRLDRLNGGHRTITPDAKASRLLALWKSGLSRRLRAYGSLRSRGCKASLPEPITNLSRQAARSVVSSGTLTYQPGARNSGISIKGSPGERRCTCTSIGGPASHAPKPISFRAARICRRSEPAFRGRRSRSLLLDRKRLELGFESLHFCQ